MFRKHKIWWLFLVGGSLAVSVASAGKPDLFYILGGATGILILSAILAAIPALLFKLIFRTLRSKEFMSMYTAAWVLVAVALLAIAHVQGGSKPIHSPLNQAVIKGDLPKLRDLLRGSLKPPSQDDLNNALLAAAGVGQAEAAGILISQGADPNAEVAATQHTPLIIAARENKPKVLEVLLQNGADPNKSNVWDWKPLHHAILPRGARIEVIRLLLEYKADVNALDSLMRTPLHRAAAFGHQQAVMILLQNGANKHAQEHKGLTPAQLAKDHPSIAHLISEY